MNARGSWLAPVVTHEREARLPDLLWELPRDRLVQGHMLQALSDQFHNHLVQCV